MTDDPVDDPIDHPLRFWRRTLTQVVVVVIVATVAIVLIAPRLRDVARRRPVCSHLIALHLKVGTFCTHGADPADEVAGDPPPATGGAVFCYGDGIEGHRVEAIYAHAVDVADRFGQVADSLHGFAAAVDAVFNDSAAETGGVRHVRYVVDPGGCVLTIHDLQLSAAGDDTFSNTINEVAALGFNHPDRKYLMWVDANIYCGIATIDGDDRPGQDNPNNAGPSYSRVDRGCWGGSAEAHELMHNLGGVQLSAQHSTKAYHSYDEWDRMTYNDGGAYFANGGQLTFPCSDRAHDRLFDCGHDDYYSTAPAAGSYLTGKWNTANSVYLETVDGSTTPPPTTTTQPPPTTTTLLPRPTTTTGPTTTTRPGCGHIVNITFCL